MAASPVQHHIEAPLRHSVAERFRRLESLWNADTQFLSDPERIINRRAFQEIIGLGDEVVPLMLADLETAPSLWVWALREITHENPVPPSDSGNIRKMSEAWLKWGRGRKNHVGKS